MNERFENINLLRAFAALAVVVYHVITFMNWEAFPFGGPLLVFRIGWVGVDLFFVISGYVITRSALALWRRDGSNFRQDFWARRLSRIVPLYLLTCALWIVFFKQDFFDHGQGRWLVQVGTHLTFTHSFFPTTFDSIDGVNWTLALEMQFYLLVAVFVAWIARAPGWRIWLFCMLIAWTWRGAIFYFYGHLTPGLLFMRLMQLPGVLDEFGAGIFLAKLLDPRPSPTRLAGLIWVAAAIAAGTACFGIYWAHAEYWDNRAMIIFWRTSLGTFFLCVVAAAIHLPSIAKTWPLRPVWYLGVVSYGVYLWHMFAVKLCLMIPDVTPLQALGITLGLTVLLAAMSWHFFEKPILDFGRRFHGRSAPPQQTAAAGES
ncbi:MAG: acyltransferase [Casimicrobiaceae bacterium]